jgi:hypothetical protein
VFRLVDRASRQDWDALDGLFDYDWETALTPFFEEYGTLDSGPAARGPQLFTVEPGPDEWTVRQVLADPDGDRGWSIDAVVSVAESDEAGDIVFDDITVTAG